MSTDSPDLVSAKRLLDQLKVCGFQFRRTAPGPDGPLLGIRVTGPWTDTIHLAGFSDGCFAWRQRNSPLIVPGGELIEHRTHGTALSVLNDVLTWRTES